MDGSEAAVTATTTTSHPQMKNHVFTTKPLAKASRLSSCLRTRGKEILPSVKSDPCRFDNCSCLHLFKTCRATQELKIIFHIFYLNLYLTHSLENWSTSLLSWLVLKYLWTCNLHLPAQSRLFAPERQIVVGEGIFVVRRDLYLVWMTLQQVGQRSMSFYLFNHLESEQAVCSFLREDPVGVCHPFWLKMWTYHNFLMVWTKSVIKPRSFVTTKESCFSFMYLR